MYKVIAAYGEVKSPDGTSFNDFPVGWRSISQKDFTKSMFFSHTAKLIEYRQMYVRAEGGGFMGQGVHAHLYWFHDNTGVAQVAEEGTIKYFAFGCAHVWRELGHAECRERKIHHSGGSWHLYECKKCEYREGVDSSD